MTCAPGARSPRLLEHPADPCGPLHLYATVHLPCPGSRDTASTIG